MRRKGNSILLLSFRSSLANYKHAFSDSVQLDRRPEVRGGGESFWKCDPHLKASLRGKREAGRKQRGKTFEEQACN